MPKKQEPKHQETKDFPNKIVWEPMPGKMTELTAPSLITLFWSERLQKQYDRDPKRAYSVQELLEMMELPCSSSSLRDHIKMNFELFDTEKKVRVTRKGLTIVNVAKLKPSVKSLIDTIKRLKDEL
jgi:hypothetical protein